MVVGSIVGVTEAVTITSGTSDGVPSIGAEVISGVGVGVIQDSDVGVSVTSSTGGAVVVTS